jgi:arylsulfatase A-like enzyme
MIILEAMSAQAFDPARDNLEDMPNVRRLVNQSFLMKTHYTTVPYTGDATFSILTSLYSYEAFGYVDHVVTLPGIVRNLDDEGYKTGFYGWVWRGAHNRDDILLTSLGFAQFGPPLNDKSAVMDSKDVFYGPAKPIEAYDHRALSILLSDIHDWTAAKQRFAAVFSPEVGHDPYRELGPHRTDAALLRGRALAVHQDAWLGELLDELQKDGVLEDTIIVLTGDHGMRGAPGGLPIAIASRGLLPDVELRVPMLISVPGVLRQPVYIDSPTSHVDIAPTVKDLLGVDAGRDLEQGLPVYSAAIKTRHLFLSTGPFGASGFYSNGYYYCSGVVGLVYKSPTLDWAGSRPLPFDDAEAVSVRSLLREHAKRQNQLIQSVLSGVYH